MRYLSEWLYRTLGLTAEAQHDLIFSAVALAVLWLLGRLLLRLVIRQQVDTRKQYQWRKVINYIITILGIIILANIWFRGFHSIVTFLGLLSAGLVLALKEPLLNMAGWLFVIWKRPFRIGDRVEIDNHIGDVIDIRLFQFTLNELHQWVEADQATGRVVHVPNGKLFTSALVNYNFGFPFIWQEIAVAVTFESNWQKAKSILMEVAGRHSENLSEVAQQQVRRKMHRHLIFYKDFDPKVYTKVRENGIQLTVRYLCAITRRRESEHLFWEAVLTQFIPAPDIQFAYPTTRFYEAPEQKPPLG